jgi:hypothetical protein
MIGLAPSLAHKKMLMAMILAVCVVTVAFAQGGYSSGSTGADGAFNPTSSTTVQIPESGVFNYTTVSIPSGVTITYKRNSKNTPVTILATGNVTIGGIINIDGASSSNTFVGGLGGPGGFDGGRGGTAPASNQDGLNGSGPGGGGGGRFNSSGVSGTGGYGGYATAGSSGSSGGGSFGGTGGAVYGSPTIIPLIGGSGGGGGAGVGTTRGGSGGGGGGAILIASSTGISGSGSILARGAGVSCPANLCGGYGAGGAIRLAANTITGGLALNVSGGLSSAGAGYISIEAFDTTGFSPSISPSNAVVSTIAPRQAVPTNAPQLRIVSVAGINAPTYVSGSFNGADIVLPTAQTGPVTVALAANNIPLTTAVQVTVIPPNGASTTVQSGALTGTQSSSTATASVTLPNGTSLIYATATIDLTLLSYLKPLFIEGERVRNMEISATFGGRSELTYITESGKRIKRASE